MNRPTTAAALALHVSALLVVLASSGVPARAQCPEFQPPGLAGDVFALTVFGDELYAGGDFDAADGVAASRIARWNGNAWAPLGPPIAEGLSGGAQVVATALAVFDDGAGPALWIAGAFDEAGAHEAHGIARWDGTSWTPLGLGAGFDDAVLALCVHDPDGAGPEPERLWAGGAFRNAGGAPAAGLAVWDPEHSTWRPVVPGAAANGVDGVVHALASHAGSLFLGGRFERAGSVAASNLARFDGAAFHAVARTSPGPRDGGGTDGLVSALAIADTGAGPELYVGGAFTRAGSVATGPIARLAGDALEPLGAGLGGVGARAPRVFGLTAVDTGAGSQELVVAGRYARAGSIDIGGTREVLLAAWDGASWLELGRVDDDARAAALHAGELVVAGRFQTAGRGGASRIARRDAVSGELHALVQGAGMGGVVRALASHDFGLPGGTGPELVVAGDFRAAGLRASAHIARRHANAWEPLAEGTDGPVHALADFGGELVAAGSFTRAGDGPAANVARFDGARWHALGRGLGADTFALCVFDGALVAGGAFETAGAQAAPHVARWDGVRWEPLGAGTDGPVLALAVFDDGSGPALYAGGDFERAGQTPVRYVARWDGAQWHALGLGTEGPVRALAVFDDGTGPGLFAGGDFQRAGSRLAPHVARWRGGAWRALGTGVDGSVHALAAVGSGASGALWVGGDFAHAGPSVTGKVARWSAAGWSAATSGALGTDEAVLALLPFDGLVYAGGEFTRVDETRVASHLAALGCPP